MVPLLHHGMVIVGLPMNCTAMQGVDKVKGGSFYGATAVVGDGSRPVSS